MNRGVLYGYVRVSSKDQNIARQIEALTRFGVEKKNIYVDKQSGKNFERIQYKKMMDKLRPDDWIVFSSLDRLGRNYKEILEQWNIITTDKKCQICVLDMPLLNTLQTDNDLTRTLLTNIVLQLLSYVAELEHKNIKKRQAEGIAIAKANGVKFGRSCKPIPRNFKTVVGAWLDGEITGREATRQLERSSAWFYRTINKLGLKVEAPCSRESMQ